MSLYVLYEAGISATYEDISDRVRLYTLDMTQNAEEGAVALSRIIIDDPDGDYEIKGYRRLAIYENQASFGSNALLYNGFIVDRTIIRGPYLTGAGRQWVCSVADTNCLMEFRLMVGADANRPAENDVQRVQWLLTTSEFNRIPNTSFVNTTGPVAMDPVDYRGQRAVDILNDCSQASGKNYFAFCLDSTPAPLPSAPGATNLWYDWADSTAHSSIIRLSNVHSDLGGNTYAIADDTELERDPSRVYSGALVNYDGGTAYEEDLTISNEFTRRDAVVPSGNIKTNAKATARALRYLDEFRTEEDRIRTAVRLPNAKVNFVKYGMRVLFKASHLPGYESFTWLRVLRSTIKQDSEDEYLVTLELGTGPAQAAPAVPVGEGSIYMAVDNGFFPITASELFINGVAVNVPSDGDPNQRDSRFEIPDGVLTSGDNVIAVGIENGTNPASWWGGNFTGLLLRAYLGTDDSGPAIVASSTSTLIWPVENLAGTINGEPGGWEQAAFDDSGWDNAFHVGPIDGLIQPGLDDQFPPTAPAQWVGPEAATTPFGPGNTYPQGLIWLARIHFTL